MKNYLFCEFIYLIVGIVHCAGDKFRCVNSTHVDLAIDSKLHLPRVLRFGMKNLISSKKGCSRVDMMI